MKRPADARVTFWTLGVTAIAVAIALFVAWWVLPTPAEIAALRTERDARADLHRCGRGTCVFRLGLKAPRYDESSDYWLSGVQMRR